MICSRCKVNEAAGKHRWCRSCQAAARAKSRWKVPSSAVAVPTPAEARESFERIMAGCGHAAAVRALHAAYTSDPAIRQALGSVRGFAGFWMKVMAALDGPGGTDG